MSSQVEKESLQNKDFLFFMHAIDKLANKQKPFRKVSQSC